MLIQYVVFVKRATPGKSKYAVLDQGLGLVRVIVLDALMG
jgi:hypothetical protein